MKHAKWILPLTFLALVGCSKKSKTPETAVPGSTPAARKPVSADNKGDVKTRPAARHPAPRAQTDKTTPSGAHPRVIMKTSMGDIVIELYPDKAPISVKNFLRYVDEKFYDGTIFHRVIKNFMIQGGGFTPDFKKKPTHEPIKNEADNGLKNERGTIAMARTMALDSATAQFYINVKDNPGLDHRGNDPRHFGYCVFGKVVKGMDVADKIRNVATGAKGPFTRDCPLQTVTILSVRRLPSGSNAIKAQAAKTETATANSAAAADKKAPRTRAATSAKIKPRKAIARTASPKAR